MSIPKEILDRIDNETDIVALASEFIKLERRGKNYMGLCPFHEENTPSFSVSPEKNIAKCMGCGEGGRPINFYRQIKNIPFQQAAKELADILGIEVETYTNKEVNPNTKLFELMKDAQDFYKFNLTNSLSGLEVVSYLNRRKINNESIEYFNLGYSPDQKDALYQYLKSKEYNTTDMIDVGLIKSAPDGTYYDFFRNRLMFPITDSYGKPVGFSARALSAKENTKYVNSPDTKIFKKSLVLYNINEAGLEIKRKKQAILFEGFFDVISAHQNGVKNGIATMGTSLTIEQIRLIKNLTNNVLVAFDGDNAGINATLKITPGLLQNKMLVEVLKLPDKVDPDDYIKNNGGEAFLKLIEKESYDAYEFEYNYYLNNTNLNNANEIQIFINNVKKMLSFATPAIIAIYRKKLANNLNIDESSIKIVAKDMPVIDTQPKRIKIKLPSKYEQAEKRLLILMIRSKVWCERITDRLTINDYSNLTLSNIRGKLVAYYSLYNDFDLRVFKDLLNEDELNYFEEKIQKNPNWINQNHLDEKEIEQYIELLKITSKERRKEYLMGLITEKYRQGDIVERELTELSQIQLTLKKVKEN